MLSFGRHRFDLETGRLWSGKREIKLTPKATAVLKALVTHAGSQSARKSCSLDVEQDRGK